MDAPCFQRLRNIFQTSLALYTYPCAVHSRFEHSLGVAILAEKMLEAIGRKGVPLAPVLKLETRLAALLHDLGHGPFSHTSERFYEGFDDFELIKSENRDLFADAAASEILTYCLLTSDSFNRLWNRVVELYGSECPHLREVKLSRIASMIVGSDHEVGPEARFYRQIVNGPFDADKLDYLSRDGYFTGLHIAVDVDRLLHTIKVIFTNAETELGVVSSGASILEQVLFAKTQLFSTLYHHHKVRAAHRLLLQLMESMAENSIRPRNLDLRDPASYIALDDYDFLSYKGSPHVDNIIDKIKCRNLPMRALVLTYPCFMDHEDREKFSNLADEDFQKLEKDIAHALSLPFGSVIVDSPEKPRLLGTGQAVVELAPGTAVPLQELYPAGAWATAYAGYRQACYVFTTAHDRRRVAYAAIQAFNDRGVRLKETAKLLAKLP